MLHQEHDQHTEALLYTCKDLCLPQFYAWFCMSQIKDTAKLGRTINMVMFPQLMMCKSLGASVAWQREG